MKQDVVIFGATGKVGKTLIHQILKKDGDKRRIVGVASSKNWLYDSSGLISQAVSGFSKRDIKGEVYNGNYDYVLDEVRKRQKVHTSFVDVTPSTEMTSAHLRIVGDPFYGGIVTANKNPLIGDLEAFEKLTSNNGRYQFHCSVMAGAGVIDKVDEARELGDEILGIGGCFSGTLAYLCDQMRKGVLYSEALRDARSPEKGYTETDERIDLSGGDARNKLLILARGAGMKINLGDIKLSPFLPEEAFVKGESLDNFRKKMREYDSYFKDMIGAAESRGNTIQYLAKMWKPSVDDLCKKLSPSKIIPIPIPTEFEVGIEEIPKSSLLGGLEGTL